ncbi:50S ribosomal protein L13 [Candidatus Phytoplasma pini]|uniref:Large ribosomal subunit protein uL13 n=1 Tax=Candidatus Phytoplasma pini TaxID=267362 RepID=A0A559KJM0_9MOLU|nr:50S ribosomal protein L13 [Candidatus Phytoplasma pini]TVY12307.1 50S ribosomal protein L13 [Candidatus Phytoplasma pini]
MNQEKKKDTNPNNKTLFMNNKSIKQKWYLIDVKGKTLGRFATKVASILKGKCKSSFTPNIDNGDFVIVVNAAHINLTGKKWKQKFYYRHSGYPGGLSKINAIDMIKKFPNRVVEKAIFGMIPHTKLGDHMRKKLFVYPNEFHKHESQKPKFLEV